MDELSQELETAQTEQVQENSAEDTQQVSESGQAQESAKIDDTLPPEQQRGYIARLKEKNEKLEQRLESLEGKLNETSGKSDEVKEQYQKELQAIKDEYARDKVVSRLENELLKSGCIDTQALMAHVKVNDLELDGTTLKGVDFDVLKTSYPYLFKSPTISSAAQSKAQADDDFEKRFEKQFGL